MQERDMKVLIVNREDYDGILCSIYGLRNISAEKITTADLIVDGDTGKILKSRYFRTR